jgi:hypothetical protein
MSADPWPPRRKPGAASLASRREDFVLSPLSYVGTPPSSYVGVRRSEPTGEGHRRSQAARQHSSARCTHWPPPVLGVVPAGR